MRQRRRDTSLVLVLVVSTFLALTAIGSTVSSTIDSSSGGSLDNGFVTQRDFRS